MASLVTERVAICSSNAVALGFRRSCFSTYLSSVFTLRGRCDVFPSPVGFPSMASCSSAIFCAVERRNLRFATSLAI